MFFISLKKSVGLKSKRLKMKPFYYLTRGSLRSDTEPDVEPA